MEAFAYRKEHDVRFDVIEGWQKYEPKVVLNMPQDMDRQKRLFCPARPCSRSRQGQACVHQVREIFGKLDRGGKGKVDKSDYAHVRLA